MPYSLAQTMTVLCLLSSIVYCLNCVHGPWKYLPPNISGFGFKPMEHSRAEPSNHDRSPVFRRNNKGDRKLGGCSSTVAIQGVCKFEACTPFNFPTKGGQKNAKRRKIEATEVVDECCTKACSPRTRSSVVVYSPLLKESADRQGDRSVCTNEKPQTGYYHSEN